MEKAHRLAPTMKLPILMQVAGDDHLVDGQTSKLFFEKLTVEDKTLHLYDGLYHEVYNELEPDRKKVLNDLENWIMARVESFLYETPHPERANSTNDLFFNAFLNLL